MARVSRKGYLPFGVRKRLFSERFHSTLPEVQKSKLPLPRAKI